MNLEETVREHHSLIKKKQPDPSRGEGATILSLLSKTPCTVVLAEPKRMILQEDLISPDGMIRDGRGKMHTFLRRKGGRWYQGGGIEKQDSVGVIIGVREYSRTPPELL